MKSSLTQRNTASYRTNSFATAIISLLSFSVFFLVAAFLLYVIYDGFRAYSPGILGFTGQGIGNQLFNTVYLLVLSLLFSVPVGVLAGLAMAEYMGAGLLSKGLTMAVETLSSLPSVVVGLFGYVAFVTAIGAQWNLLSGALTVSFLTVPLITATTYDALRALPKGYKEGSLSLGATHFETLRKVLVPAAFGRIMTGIILAAGRVFGEAAALLYTVGMSTDFSWQVWDLTSSQCPLNPFRPGETLALSVWSSRMDGLGSHAADMASVASAVLVLMTFVFTISASRLGGYFLKKSGGIDHD